MRLTIHEVADCLDVPLSTVERWIRQGRIPIRKTSGKCVFQKEVLEVWARKHNLPFSISEEKHPDKFDGEPANLSFSISRGGVFHGIKGDNPGTVLRSVVDMISFIPQIQREELYQKLLEREALNSTGIGKGIAIPHPRTPFADVIREPVIVTCFLERPIDFRAIDDQLVFVLFVLLSPSVKIHLHLLSRLAYCVRDEGFLKFLRTIPDESSLVSRIEDLEKVLE